MEKEDAVSKTQHIVHQSARKESTRKKKRIDHVTASYQYPNVVYACGKERGSEIIVLNTQNDPLQYFSPRVPQGKALGLTTGRCNTNSTKACIYILLYYRLKVFVYYMEEQRQYKDRPLSSWMELSFLNKFGTALIGFAIDDELQFYFLKFDKPTVATVVLQSTFRSILKRTTIKHIVQFFDIDSKGQKVLFGTGGIILLSYLKSGGQGHVLDISTLHKVACIAYKDVDILIVNQKHPFRVTYIKESW